MKEEYIKPLTTAVEIQNESAFLSTSLGIGDEDYQFPGDND